LRKKGKEEKRDHVLFLKSEGGSEKKRGKERGGK